MTDLGIYFVISRNPESSLEGVLDGSVKGSTKKRYISGVRSFVKSRNGEIAFALGHTQEEEAFFAWAVDWLKQGKSFSTVNNARSGMILCHLKAKISPTWLLAEATKKAMKAIKKQYENSGRKRSRLTFRKEVLEGLVKTATKSGRKELAIGYHLLFHGLMRHNHIRKILRADVFFLPDVEHASVYTWDFKTGGSIFEGKTVRVYGIKKVLIQHCEENRLMWDDPLFPNWSEDEALAFFRAYLKNAGIATFDKIVDMHCFRKSGAQHYFEVLGMPASHVSIHGTWSVQSSTLGQIYLDSMSLDNILNTRPAEVDAKLLDSIRTKRKRPMTAEASRGLQIRLEILRRALEKRPDAFSDPLSFPKDGQQKDSIVVFEDSAPAELKKTIFPQSFTGNEVEVTDEDLNEQLQLLEEEEPNEFEAEEKEKPENQKEGEVELPDDEEQLNFENPALLKIQRIESANQLYEEIENHQQDIDNVFRLERKLNGDMTLVEFGRFSSRKKKNPEVFILDCTHYVDTNGEVVTHVVNGTEWVWDIKFTFKEACDFGFKLDFIRNFHSTKRLHADNKWKFLHVDAPSNLRFEWFSDPKQVEYISELFESEKELLQEENKEIIVVEENETHSVQVSEENSEVGNNTNEEEETRVDADELLKKFPKLEKTPESTLDSIIEVVSSEGYVVQGEMKKWTELSPDMQKAIIMSRYQMSGAH